MISILNIFFIAVGLSMDAFSLSVGYGMNKNKVFLLPVLVSIFHFIMPYIGYLFNNLIINNIVISSKYILFIIFLVLSVDMLISFFEKKEIKKKESLLNLIILSLSVSLDSLTVGFGMKYLYNNILVCISMFSLVSFLFTNLGLFLSKLLSKKFYRYSYLIGSAILILYALLVLTN